MYICIYVYVCMYLLFHKCVIETYLLTYTHKTKAPNDSVKKVNWIFFVSFSYGFKDIHDQNVLVQVTSL